MQTYEKIICNPKSFQEDLAKMYKYKKLPENVSKNAINTYKKNIPGFLNVLGDDVVLFSLNGSFICNRYNRIVIGDYGAFIEFNGIEEDFVIPLTQLWRLHEKYIDTKYIWYTPKKDPSCKIYKQINNVSYADYVPGKWYVSVFDVKI
jgi:hypothetical protein